MKGSGDFGEAVGGVMGVIVECPLGASSMKRVLSAVDHQEAPFPVEVSPCLPFTGSCIPS